MDGASLDVGSLLRTWREKRRLTQLELALEAGISTRHLSFVETGRSKPGRELLLAVTDRLAIPYRERNEILLTAGYAPAFPERSLDEPALLPVRESLNRILGAHEPYPGFAFDRAWNLVAANTAASKVFGREAIEASLLEPPVNVLRLGCHPRGLAPYIVNLNHWRSHFLGRLAEQVTITGDRELSSLLEELSEYPGGTDHGGANDPLGAVRIRAPGGGEWTFFGMFATFDTPFEVTTSELAMELLFPADEHTRRALDGRD
jgi:transcriptional regulator with XRE-family HTH domain